MSTRDDLLLTLADADASYRPNREQFFMVETFSGTTIGHPALPGGEIRCHKPDVLDLIDLAYLRPTYASNALFLDVTDAGFDEASRARLSGAMHRSESPAITVMAIGEDAEMEASETPPDIEAERERLAKIATDFGWRIGFAQEPDGSWFWLVMDAETDEPIKSGTAPTWQDALIDCVKDLVPPNPEDGGRDILAFGVRNTQVLSRDRSSFESDSRTGLCPAEPRRRDLREKRRDLAEVGFLGLDMTAENLLSAGPHPGHQGPRETRPGSVCTPDWLTS